MVSVASAGIADRMAARTFFKVPRAGSGTAARYSSTSFGAPLPFAAEPRLPEFAFFMRAILQERSFQVYASGHHAAARGQELSWVPDSPPFGRLLGLPAIRLPVIARHSGMRPPTSDLSKSCSSVTTDSLKREWKSSSRNCAGLRASLPDLLDAGNSH